MLAHHKLSTVSTVHRPGGPKDSSISRASVSLNLKSPKPSEEESLSRQQQIRQVQHSSVLDGCEGESRESLRRDGVVGGLQGLKILLPHVGLTTLLLSYIAGGAAVFQWLEEAADVEKRREKAALIRSLYSSILKCIQHH